MAKPNKVVHITTSANPAYRDNQPKLRTRAETEDFRGAKVKKHSDYWQQIDAEKERYSHDWNSDNEAFFQKFREDNE